MDRGGTAAQWRSLPRWFRGAIVAAGLEAPEHYVAYWEGLEEDELVDALLSLTPQALR